MTTVTLTSSQIDAIKRIKSTDEEFTAFQTQLTKFEITDETNFNDPVVWRIISDNIKELYSQVFEVDRGITYLFSLSNAMLNEIMSRNGPVYNLCEPLPGALPGRVYLARMHNDMRFIKLEEDAITYCVNAYISRRAFTSLYNFDCIPQSDHERVLNVIMDKCCEHVRKGFIAKNPKPWYDCDDIFKRNTLLQISGKIELGNKDNIMKQAITHFQSLEKPEEQVVEFTKLMQRLNTR